MPHQKKVAKQPSAKMIAARAKGIKGGLARANNLTKEQKSAIGYKAGKATFAAYGSEYYSAIAAMRKNPGRKKRAVKDANENGKKV
jgi:hypothetical protein